MTRENIAIYLTVMAKLAREPMTTVDFVMKYKTDRQVNKACELERSLEETFDIVRTYHRNSAGYIPRGWENAAKYWDEVKIHVEGGSWRHKQQFTDLKKELERRKISYELTEWRCW